MDDRQHLAIAVDVTQGEFYLKEKFLRIKEEINNGTLTTVKYFEDSNGNKKALPQCPRVVLGLDREHVAELAALWVNDKKQELAQHPAQLLLLQEVEFQLDAFKRYAEAHDRKEVVAIYEQDLSIIRKIRRQKEKGANIQHHRTDKVAEIIQRETQRFNVFADSEQSLNQQGDLSQKAA